MMSRRLARAGMAMMPAAVLTALTVFTACVGEDPQPTNGTSPDGAAPLDDASTTNPDASTEDATGTSPDGSTSGEAGGSNAVVDVSGGEGFACAVRQDGSVVCWGLNTNGETGQPRTGGDKCEANAECRQPTKVAGITDALKIASGRHQSCVVTKDGKVLCWGMNEDGVLGRAPGMDVACEPGTRCNETPTAVPGVANMIGVAVGKTNACAWNEDGQVTCWGHDRVGGLGRGDPADSIASPGLAQGFAGSGATLVAVDSFGNGHYCAARVDTEVSCWGRNSAGELGVNSDSTDTCPFVVGSTPGNDRCAASPITVSAPAGGAIMGVTSIAATDGATCVSAGTGSSATVYCWGYAGYGITKTPLSSATNLSPMPRDDLAALSLSALSGSYAHVCGLTSASEVACWGGGSFGELGVAPTLLPETCGVSGGGKCRSTAATVTGVKAKKVFAGPNATYAITLDGQLLAWGANRHGQLGHLPRPNENGCVPGACNPAPEEVVLP